MDEANPFHKVNTSFSSLHYDPERKQWAISIRKTATIGLLGQIANA